MIKVFLTIRNRLGITKKCIFALFKNTTRPLRVHIYDNLTNFQIREHFEYAYNLYKHKLISSYNFNTEESTFGAFSKAVASNQFGFLHMMDPYKNNYDFLLILDNDVIVYPGWDNIIFNVWNFIKEKGMDHIKIVTQYPGGTKSRVGIGEIDGFELFEGKFGGSDFWCVKPDFFDEVGFLDIRNLKKKNKGHDIQYWKLLDKASGGRPYTVCVKAKICFNCGAICGSVCNELTRNMNRPAEHIEKLISFEEVDKQIESMSFDEFMNKISGY